MYSKEEIEAALNLYHQYGTVTRTTQPRHDGVVEGGMGSRKIGKN